MLTSLKKLGMSCLLLICTCSLNACNKPSEKSLTQSPAKNSTEIFALEKEVEYLKPSSLNNKSKIAGSKKPGKWIQSNNGTIACRVKEWYVVGTEELPESYIDVEVTNIKSKKPINAVYELLAIDKKGQVLRTISNAFKDNQPIFTDFKPPLKRGQTKVSHFHSKLLLTMSKLELKKCRVSEANEDASTINPEMNGYPSP